MAHLVETMAYANEAPWHKLGVQVDGDISCDDMRIRAGLDWSINKEGLITKDSKQTVPEYYALVRSTDHFVLGHCGKAYKPIQPKEVLTFFHEFVVKGGMKMETAGSLDNGRHIFALASIQESFELAGGNGKDKVDGYLLFSSPNTAGKRMRIMFTPIRVVCNNTLTMALSNATGRGEFALHHSQTFDSDAAKGALGLAKGQLDEFKEVSNFLASKQVKEDALRQYFNVLWPTKSKQIVANDNSELSNTAEAAMTIFHEQPGANLHPNTWWNAFNTVTYITDHVTGRSDNTRLRRAWFGDGKNLKTEALQLAVDQARAA